MVLNIEKNSIIYVISPAYYKTGGTELAHQLVFSLNRMGKKAYITYYDTGDFPFDINPEFRAYVDTYKNLNEIVDTVENIIIVPETRIEYLTKYNNIQKCVWWMSVDNYLKNDGILGAIECYGFARALKKYICNELRGTHHPINQGTVHFYQSEYAKRFLLKHGVVGIRLSDYININFRINADSMISRNDVVLYNPKKGIKFTQKIMKAAPEFEWRPLEKMTTQEVYKNLSTSKVYIDFGEHPGKDRFPREAAICGCCVITGKKGAAKYYEDIPIDDKFKFNDRKSDINKIIKTIRYCIDDYEDASKNFDSYREFISNEKDIFERDVENIFGGR